MKNGIKLVIASILLNWSVIGFCEVGNLVENYGFEEELDAWTVGKRASRTNQDKYQGNHAAQIVSMKAEGGSNVRLYSPYLAYLGGPLKVSAWLKAKNIAAGKKSWNIGLFHMLFYDENKKQLGSHSCVKSIGGSTNWVEAKRTYYPAEMKKDKWHSIPVGTAFIRLEFLLSNCTGAFLVDDVKVIGKKKSKVKNKDATAGMSASEKAEYARLLLATRKPKKNKVLHQDEGNLLVMEDIVLPEKTVDPTKRFPKVPKMEVKQGGIYLNGRPALMLGVENHFRLYPFLYKLLGMDYVVLAVSDSANTEVNKLDSRTYHVSWRDYKWLDTLLKMVADQGLWSYIDFWIGGIPVRSRFPDMAIQDPPQHFIWLRFTHPAVQRYLYNYSRSIAKIARNYPVFGYELLNEIMYTSPYHPVNLTMFREEMVKQYKTIENANSTWNTSFKSFAEVIPPKKGGVSGSVLNLPLGFSKELFCDYTKFTETLLAGHIEKWRRDFRKSEPDGMTFVQAINGMWMDYGNQGVNPEIVIESEDALGCECGITFIPQPAGAENNESIKNMTMRLMTRDVWRSVSPDKPLIDGESPLSVAAPPTPKPFVDLEGKWKFKTYAADEGKSEKKRHDDTLDQTSDKSWTQLNYDDRSWQDIQVPGMWGKEGFPKTYIGLYRKKITIPSFQGPLYLTGLQLSDYADIYVNGKLVWQTKIWSENFCVNIADKVTQNAENEIAIRIYNKYYEGGMYWGGIRGNIQLVRSSAELQPLTPGQMRSYLWTCAAHGYSATTLTYFYSGEGIDYPFSLLNPAYISRDALKAIPKVKKEIETVADIVLPRPRIKGKVGLFYPFEAFRYHVPKDAVEALKAPLSKNLLDYYQSLLFSQMPFDMVTSQQILDGKADHYKALIFRMADMVKPGVIEKLKEYAAKGGLVIINYGSLQKESKYYKPLDISELAGVTLGQPVRMSQLVRFADGKQTETRLVQRNLSDVFGVQLFSKTAAVLATYQDNSPAITSNEVGKGNVVYIACELPKAARTEFLITLLKKHGIEGDICVAGKDKLGSYVEGHQFVKDKRYVWYLNNWGENAEITVKPVNALADESYRVRNVVTGSIVKSPTQAEIWTKQELDKGITFMLNSQNPVIFLIEPTNIPAIKMMTLTKAHEQVLKRVWNRSPKADFRILVDCKRSSLYSPFRTPTLTWLLEDNDYQIMNSVSRISDSVKVTNNDLITQEKLADFNILSLPGIQASGATRGFSKEELRTIEQYVKNGGGLFLTGQFMRGPHGHMSSSYASKVTELFGVKIRRDAVADPKNHILGEDRFVSFNVKGENPLLTGVSIFQSMGMAPLTINDSTAIPLISTSENGHAMYDRRLKGNLPVMASLEYGKGRVVIMGDASWMQPTFLTKADNAQLALNIFNWLAKRPIKKLPEAELKRLNLDEYKLFR